MIIIITEPQDLAFMQIAQLALVNSTTFPSGWVSPPEDMIIVDDHLEPVAKESR